MRMILLLSLAACMMAANGRAQAHRATGVRILGMAGASAALPTEGWGASANAASLAGNTVATASAFVIPALYGLSELSTVAASVSYPLPAGAIGAVVSRFGFELYKETAVSLGAGFHIVSGVALGATVHARSVAIARYGSCLSWTLDAGVVAEILDEMWIGSSVRSLLGSVPLMPGGHLPTTLSWAGAVSPREGTLLTAELEKEEGFPLAAKVGIELLVVDELAIRSGAATNPQVFSAGASLRISLVEFGYAGFLHQDLGWTHGLELRIRGSN